SSGALESRSLLGYAVDEAGERRAQGQVVHADRADLGDVVVAFRPDHRGDGPLLGEPGGGEGGDLALAELGVALGDGEDQRDRGFQQAGQRVDLGGGPAAEVAHLELAALGAVGDLVEAGQQARALDAVERAAVFITTGLAGHVGGDVHAAGRVAGHHDPRRVAAVARDVAAHPLDGGGDVLGARRPGELGGEAVGDRDADPAVADSPRADVV